MRIFLFIAALSVAMLNIINVKGMEPESLLPDLRLEDFGEASCPGGFQLRQPTAQGYAESRGLDGQVEEQATMDVEQAKLELETILDLAPGMLFKTFALLQLQEKELGGNGLLTHHVCRLILDDLCYVYVLPTEFSAHLKKNKSNPDEVIRLICLLLKKCGQDISVSVLKMALADAQMSIGSILGENNWNCLHALCRKLPSDKGIHDLACMKIILCIAPNAWDLISFLDTYDEGWAPWHDAIWWEHDDIVDLFIKWANDNDMIRKLLSMKAKKQSTALHIAAFMPCPTILKTLLEQAKKYYMVQELLDAKDRDGQTVLEKADRCVRYQYRADILASIQAYIPKSKHEPMSLEYSDEPQWPFDCDSQNED